MRAILPGISNDFISVLKGTSIASVIFVNELTFRAQQSHMLRSFSLLY